MQERESISSGRHSRRQRRWVGWTVSLIVFAAGITWSVRLFPASPALANRQMEAAASETLERLLKNSACPHEPEAIQEAAANLFVILNPDLAHQERRKAPAFLQEEAAAVASFSNPGALHAKKMEDPNYRRNYQAAMQAFVQEARKAQVRIAPTATDAAQIEALRNNPEWRRQREEPMRAMMSTVQQPTN